jgi:hypothetical protein
MDTISTFIGHLKLGLECGWDQLAMFPLLAGSGDADLLPTYSVLDDALAKGWTEITEISEQGSVPELSVLNRAPRAGPQTIGSI